MNLSLSKAMQAAAMVACVVLLGGCRSDSASYMINGAEHSLSLIADQDYYWQDEWQLALVSTHQPECQRRYKLSPVPLKSLKVDVFQPLESGALIIREGRNWYVVASAQCQLQTFKTAPAEPGDLLGSFEFKDDKLRFVAVPKAPAAAAPAAAPALPATPGAATAPAPGPLPSPGAAPAALPPAAPLAPSLAAPVPAAAGAPGR